jgi:hypothetical protein
MTALILLVLVGVACIVTAIVIKTGLGAQLQADLVTIELLFPRDLEADSVEAFMTGATALLLPWWKRWMVTPTLTSEVVANTDGVRHQLVVPRTWLRTVESLLQAHLPGARFKEVPTVTLRIDIGAEYRLTSTVRPLSIDAAGLSRSLLASVQPLGDERIVISWILSPHPPVSPVGQKPGLIHEWLDGRRPRPTAEEGAALRKKQSKPLFLAVGRIGVAAGSIHRQRALLRQVEGAWHGSRAPGVHLQRRRLPERVVAHRVSHRGVPIGAWPSVMNIEELTGLIGWPIDAGHLSGVSVAGSRQLAVPRAVATTGTLIGDGWTDGRARPAALDLEARYRHSVLIGPTGSGKSTLLLNLIVQDMAAGHAVLVVDPKADLVADVLARVPARRSSDVVVIDAADSARPIGINPLRLGGVAPELAVEHLVGVLRRIFSASWGVRSDDLWRAALRTLIHDQDATLADVGPLLTEQAFRRRMIASVTDPVLVSFWRSFEAMSDAEAAQVVSPVLNKWRQVLSRPGLRRIFGQAHPTFDLGSALDHGGIVLVPLATGTLGEEAANLFGAVLLGAAWNVIQGRAAVPVGQRRPLMIHLDEFARYSAMPVPLDELLAQARSYRAGITLATQHLDQLPAELRQTVLANPRSRIAFQLGGADARLLAGEFGSGLSPADLQGLGAYEVVAQLHAAGHTQSAATLITRPAPAETSDASALREASRQRWGADGDAVDAALLERLGGQQHPGDRDAGAPTGRKRRSP